jgi:hypothetical protein
MKLRQTIEQIQADWRLSTGSPMPPDKVSAAQAILKSGGVVAVPRVTIERDAVDTSSMRQWDSDGEF